MPSTYLPAILYLWDMGYMDTPGITTCISWDPGGWVPGIPGIWGSGVPRIAP